MEKRQTVFGFLAWVFMLYGILTALLNILCMLFGNEAKELSNMFSLGSDGIGTATSWQFLLAVTCIAAIKELFMTDILIKNMNIGVRIALMFAGAFAVTVTLILVFGWFPADNALCWILFVISSAVSCGISVAVSTLAEKAENKKLEEALKQIKGGR